MPLLGGDVTLHCICSKLEEKQEDKDGVVPLLEAEVSKCSAMLHVYVHICMRCDVEIFMIGYILFIRQHESLASNSRFA